jgi:hypothetical protein
MFFRHKTSTSISEEEKTLSIDSNKFDRVSIKPERGHAIEADDKDDELSEDGACVCEGTEQMGSPYEKDFSPNPRPTPDFHINEYDSVLPSTVLDMRQAMVECIMDEFWFINAQEWTKGTSGNSPTSPNRNQDCRKPESIAPCQAFPRKRQRDDEDLPDDNGDKKSRQQRDRSGPSSDSYPRGRFACPFRKHDCQKYSVYSHRICALTSYETIGRVK